MRALLASVGTVLWKDILAEMRSKDIIISMLVFTLLVMVIFNFAFDLRDDETSLMAPGILWVTFAFAGVLGLNRSFILEVDKGCLDGLLLCPVDRGAIYMAKMLGNLLFMILTEAIALCLFVVLFNLSLHLLELVPIILLATIGFAGVGTLFAAMSVNTRAREVMLPLLVLPIVAPALIAAVKATGIVFSGGGLGGAMGWLKILMAFDFIFVTAALLVFDYLLEE